MGTVTVTFTASKLELLVSCLVIGVAFSTFTPTAKREALPETLDILV